MSQYHLWATDQRPVSQFWIEASSEDVARRLVRLNADPQAEGIRIWCCARTQDKRAPEGFIVTSGGASIVIVKR